MVLYCLRVNLRIWSIFLWNCLRFCSEMTSQQYLSMFLCYFSARLASLPSSSPPYSRSTRRSINLLIRTQFHKDPLFSPSFCPSVFPASPPRSPIPSQLPHHNIFPARPDRRCGGMSSSWGGFTDAVWDSWRTASKGRNCWRRSDSKGWGHAWDRVNLFVVFAHRGRIRTDSWEWLI